MKDKLIAIRHKLLKSVDTKDMEGIMHAINNLDTFINDYGSKMEVLPKIVLIGAGHSHINKARTTAMAQMFEPTIHCSKSIAKELQEKWDKAMTEEHTKASMLLKSVDITDDSDVTLKLHDPKPIYKPQRKKFKRK